MKYTISVAALIAVALPGLAFAESKDDDAAKDPDAISCKYTKVVGSRIPQRICLTNFEWKDRRRAQMEAKRSSANRNSGCENASGPC